MRKISLRAPWVAPVALAGAVALPALVLAVAMVGSGWQPVGIDTALEVLRTWEVGTRRTPLVGAYSRYGWDHPGPLQFIVSAPAVRLLGPEGLLVTAGLVNALAAAGAVLAAHRTAGMPLALPKAVATALMMRALGGVGVTDPWNPYVAVLPFLAYLLCVRGAANGDRVLLIAAVVAGSWCAQAHLGYLPITVAAAVLAAVLRAADRRRRPQETAGMSRWWTIAAAALGLLLWLPPLADQFAITQGPGVLAIADLSRQIRDGLDPGTTYLLIADSNWHYRVAPGPAVDLILHGQSIVVTPDLARQFRPWRAAADRNTYPQIVLLPTTKVAAWREQHPDARRIAVHRPSAAALETRSITSTPHEAWLLEEP